jgi:hypothetical protein
MTKRVEFHQAQVTVTVKVVDDERSYGTQDFSTVVLMNTNADWADLREKVDSTITIQDTDDYAQDQTWAGDHTFNGNVLFQSTVDSTTFVQVLDADGGSPILNVDTVNERVGIGTASPDALFHIESVTSGRMILENTGDSNTFVQFKAARTGSNKTIGSFAGYWGAVNRVAQMDFSAGSDSTNKDDGAINFWTSESGSSIVKRMTIANNGYVGIGTANPNTTLDVQGGQTVEITTVNVAAYNVLNTDYIINVIYPTTGACTITIPTAQVVAGRILTFKDASNNAVTNNITILSQGGELINGNASYVLNTNYQSVTLYTDGANWFSI